MEMDCFGKIFQILARHLQAMAKNVQWMTFPAKTLIDIFLLLFEGMSKGSISVKFGPENSKSPMTVPLYLFELNILSE